MGALHADARYGLAHVEEVLHRKVVRLLLQATELAQLLQLFADSVVVGSERNLVHLFLAQRTQTMLLQQ